MKIKIGRHKLYNKKVWRYLLPKRLTLKSNPPIYKWLWWFISIE